MKKTISIFFDTNILEGRSTNTLLSFSELKIPKTPFYDVIKYIDDFELWGSVEILIPDMVVMELKHHLIKEYNSNIAELKEKIQQYKELFGSLMEIDYSIITSEDIYIKYVDSLFVDFFDSSRNHSKIIETKKDGITMRRLIEKAAKTEHPFSAAGGNGKKYTDAGFKDAVIYETIVEYINCNNTIGILFTGDKDYRSTVADFKIINVNHNDKSKSFEDFKRIIKKHFNILEQNDFEVKLKDDYLKGRILEEANLKFDNYNLIMIIPGTYRINEEYICADIIVRINDDKLRIHVEYNYIANEVSAEFIDQCENNDILQEEK